jgi:uncharacterized protein YndB with AHSA1/START domain
MADDIVSSLAPVRKSVVVPLTTSNAFDLFFRRLPEWWPLLTRSVSLANAVSCHVETSCGGRLYERARDGQEHTWGRFLLFDDGERAVFTWHPGIPESEATEVEVRFVPLGNSTRVDVEHRRWERLGARASFVRAMMDGGWPGVLARFDRLAVGAPDCPTVAGPGCIPPDILR